MKEARVRIVVELAPHLDKALKDEAEDRNMPYSALLSQMVFDLWLVRCGRLGIDPIVNHEVLSEDS